MESLIKDDEAIQKEDEDYKQIESEQKKSPKFFLNDTAVKYNKQNMMKELGIELYQKIYNLVISVLKSKNDDQIRKIDHKIKELVGNQKDKVNLALGIETIVYSDNPNLLFK